MAYSIQQHLEYNRWANSRVAVVLKEVEDHIYFQEIKSSFPSIVKTVLHIWDGQNIWLNRMKGVSLQTWPSANFTGSKADSLDGLMQSSSDIIEFVASQDISFLTTTYVYNNLKGEPFEDRFEDVVSYC